MFLNSRRTFLKNSFLTTAVLVMSGSKLFGTVSPIETLSLVQDDLFPFAKEQDVDSSAYLLIILNHTHVTDIDKKFIRNGIQWLNEESVIMYKTTYTKLSVAQRQKLLKTISQTSWGESWLETQLTYIMEAIFSDKIYGVNKNEAGQKLVQHSVGLPRPTKALL